MKFAPIKESKLVGLLKSLSALEIKRLKKFLESPYHNISNERINLFVLLKKYHPAYEDIPFTKEALYAKIYGKKNYQVQKMNDLMNSLKTLVEDFMIVSDTLREAESRKTALKEAFQKRNIFIYEENSADLSKDIKTISIPLEEDYLDSYLKNKQHYFHIATEQKVIGLTTFKVAHESLDLFYLFAKFQFLTEEHDRKNIYNEEEGLITWEQIEKSIPPSSEILKKNAIIEVLYKVVTLKKKELPRAAFLELKEELNSLIGKIDSALLRDLFLKLTNYCVQKNNLGDKQYNIDCLDLYKILVANNLLLENNLIREIEYINIALLAYKYDAVDWGDNFCSTYKEHLYSDNPESIQDIVCAYKYFFLKEYKLVDKYLKRLAPEIKGFYYPKIKALVIRSLYEDWMVKKEYTPALLSHAKNYERALYRYQEIIAADKLKAYLNFIQILKKIIKLASSNLPIKKSMIDKIRKEIIEKKLVVYKDWLTDRLKDLERNVGYATSKL